MNNQKNISVFGATGKVGSELLHFLSAAGIPTIAVTRNKSKVKSLPFVDWLEADLADKVTLGKTMENSKAVFLASSVSRNFSTEQNNVIETAKEYGVQHLVKLSSPGADKNSPNFISRPNGEVEELLKASGLEWTILQPNSFMQNWLGEFSQTIQKERKIYEATGEGRKPYIDTRDIAEVAFTILTNPANHRNKTYLLTGGEAVNYYQVAEAISKVIGEKVDYISLTADEFKQRMESKGMPWGMINTFLTIAEFQRSGNATFVNDTVSKLLNKAPRTIENFARDYAPSFIMDTNGQ
ncbi:Uncharacterized conserved protein YbjT, contains NAD(P)-binding and DUF2867 domains [Chitinophaga sp. YR573]|uniref:SDR family oxidoreductase n=1 Tax=Chitinophaga sp. YR573 TaxID=1881040 RepID=UPI0008D13420|nr:SDR family oxidoreductase [Chitinophaga sp. YR573]SEW29056.1 Uncharacterized conserved protein YbjT, contains NAD(P)-binding and DUF2867 domains [Chitinophaga sp. YR573]